MHLCGTNGPSEARLKIAECAEKEDSVASLPNPDLSGPVTASNGFIRLVTGVLGVFWGAGTIRHWGEEPENAAFTSYSRKTGWKTRYRVFGPQRVTLIFLKNI